MIGMRHHHRAGLIAAPHRRRHFITPLATFLSTDIGLGATAATIGAGALEGAVAGGALNAARGKNPLTGALIGGLAGGAIEGVTGALGQSATLNSLQNSAAVDAMGNAPIIAAGSPEAAQSAQQYAAQGGTGGALGAASLGNATLVNAAPSGIDGVTGAPGVIDGGSGLNPLSSNAQQSNSGGLLSRIFGGGDGKGISNSALAMGALSALGSLSKPKMGTWATPGPSSVTQSPTFNQPLNGDFPGRTVTAPALPPMMTAPTPGSYAAYGGPEQSYFGNNTLKSYGFAHGGAPHPGAERGALNHEFSTANGEHYVQGPGDGQSDSIPAALSDGEYVWDATTVSRLGNGSNRKGAELLDRARRLIAHDAGSDRVVQKKIRKAPLQYLMEAQ